MPVINCKFFSGYKPCGKSLVCDDQCPQKNIPNLQILIIHLGALGAVLRSTALLRGIHRKYPKSRITWVTDAPADQLLENCPLIDKLYTSSERDLLELSALQFDIAFVIDKSIRATGILRRTSADLIYGFQVDSYTHSVMPANQGAVELWELGLDDHRKFHVNQKTENELIWQALELGPYRKEEYEVHLTNAEMDEAKARHATWTDQSNLVIGFNTGCSSHIPYKKWTVEFHRQVIGSLNAKGYGNVVLLGGREDHERNEKIAMGLNVHLSSTQLSLRDGLISVAACDVIVSGDSLGMHLGIGLRKQIVAWFGPTCAQEIELYDRGVKLQSKLHCAPCWKRSCSQAQMCYDGFSVEEVVQVILDRVGRCQKNHQLAVQKNHLES